MEISVPSEISQRKWAGEPVTAAPSCARKSSAQSSSEPEIYPIEAIDQGTKIDGIKLFRNMSKMDRHGVIQSYMFIRIASKIW